MCVYLSILRIGRGMEKEANYKWTKDAFRAGTPDWVGEPHQQHILYLWKSPGPHVAGRPNLGGSVRWAGCFPTPCTGFIFLVKFPTAAGLIKTEHVAYSSDDLLITCQPPLESRSPGAQRKKSRQHVLTRSWAMHYWKLCKSFQERGFKAEGGFVVCGYSLLSLWSPIYLLSLLHIGKVGILSSL